MSREQLIGLIAADSKFIDEREDITEYVRSLKAGEGLDEAAIRAGYQQLQGREGRPRAGRPSPPSTACPRPRCKASSTASSPA